uniref:Peptidase S1 domain-containing protein n=1 Tax=Musca domestica TaxID=7370 RepID=A0A1I8M9W4_MUSDO
MEVLEFERPFVKFLLVMGFICFNLTLIKAEETKTIKCGQRNLQGISTAAASTPSVGESKFGEFPWTIDIANEGRVFCVGSLIHPRVVLTAGQCVALPEDIPNLKLRAGLWDRESNPEHYPYQERSIEKIILHDDLGRSRRRRRNDIALVIVNAPFVLADHIKTVCLPPANYVAPNGTTCYATGWGKQSLRGDHSQRMKLVPLTRIEDGICEREMEIQLHSSVMCAVGQNGSDTCSGDSGGPLVSRINADQEVYHQIGITSFGISCFDGSPGGYTNVGYLREWIDEQMKANGLETTTYIHE